jgi:hypothetical protein
MHVRIPAIVLAAAATLSHGAVPDFNRDIRPILSNNCFHCHGPDAEDRKGGIEGLRLDTAEGVAADLGGYKAVVPGKPDESELVKRLVTDDADEFMPPRKTGKKLTEKEIELIRDWIKAGAPYAKHWAYEVPKRPAVPAATIPGAAIRNPVDSFIHARLAAEKLTPQPEADRYTLARRAALDITGLPPSNEEVDAFVNDSAKDAFERFVDAQLAKPAYGEHWARTWLDLARYADSAGYADDPSRSIWAFRDYVIRSYNTNKPFDQFTIEQIAGDLLPNPTEDQLIATAFHRNTMTNSEGGTQDEEFRAAAVVDRANTTMAVWMGTSFACAQCHTHKYDPITHHEYFQMYAFFNNTEDADRRDEAPLLNFMGEQQKQKRAETEKAIAEIEGRLKNPPEKIAASAQKWVAAFPSSTPWRAAVPASAKAKSGIAQTIAADGSILSAKNEAKTDVYTLEYPVNSPLALAGVRLEALPHDSLPGKGPGFASGNFVVSRIRAEVMPSTPIKGPEGRFVRIEIPGKSKFLQIAEVQVFSGGKNVAMSGVASQVSTFAEASAKRAIDGNTAPEYDKGSVAHTLETENPWWEVDLKSLHALDRIVVWNRAEAGERLDGFRVVILDADRKPVWEKSGNKAAESIPFDLTARREIVFSSAASTFIQPDFELEGVFGDTAAARKKKDKKEVQRGWAIGGATGKPHELLLAAAQPVALSAGSKLVVSIEMNSQFGGHNLGNFRLSTTDSPRAAEIIDVLASAQASLATSISGGDGWALERASAAARTQFLQAYFLREKSPELKPEREKLAALQKQFEAIKPDTVPILRELPAGKGRKTQLHIRGNYLNLGDEVKPGVPAIFHQPPKDVPMNRLTLAKWLVDPQNPLTARVVANRYWETVFGTGLVRTSEEFGAQGELPVNPDLLDWLATELIAQKWDTKAFLKMLITSATYRQASRVTPEALERDPENQLVSRGPRNRHTAEMIRDQALAVSGLLSGKMYGPSVRPARPNSGLSAAFGGGLDWQTSSGEDRYRRGIYTEWRRTSPYPSMMTFDATSRETCTIRRNRSNTPLQALVTLNDEVYIEAAQALARRITATAGTRESRIQAAYRAVLQRQPTAKEISRIAQLHAEALTVFSQDEKKAKQMATEPIGAPSKDANIPELAAWTTVANVLLNLDETLMKR